MSHRLVLVRPKSQQEVNWATIRFALLYSIKVDKKIVTVL